MAVRLRAHQTPDEVKTHDHAVSDQQSGLAAFVAALPKAETHLHIEGALPWLLLHELCPREFPTAPPSWDPAFRFASFAAFEEALLRMAMTWYTSPDRYYTAAQHIFRKLAEQNVRYVETSFASGVIEYAGISGEETAAAIQEAAPPEMTVRVFMGIHHAGYNDRSRAFIDDSHNWAHLDGIDLHGVETSPLPQWTSPFYAEAQQAGRFLKAHAGEFQGPDFIRQVIHELGVTRIEHGVRAAEDALLMEELRLRKITLDTCPISNVKLRVAKSISDHPLKDLMAAGVRCTISTDDPLVFGNTINDEYCALATEANFSHDDLIQLARNGFEVALVPDALRQRWLDELDQKSG